MCHSAFILITMRVPSYYALVIYAASMQSIHVRNLFTIYFESTNGDVDLQLDSDSNFFGLKFGDQQIEMKLYYREDDLASEWKCVPGAKAFKWPKKSQETSVPTDPSMLRFSLRIVEGILHFRKPKYFIGCVGFSSNNPAEAERFSPSFLLLPKNRNSGSNSDSDDSKPGSRGVSLPSLIVRATDQSKNPTEATSHEPNFDFADVNMMPLEHELHNYQVLAQGDAEVLGNFRALNFYRTSDMRIKFDSQKLTDVNNAEKVVSELTGIRYKMVGSHNQKFVGYSAQQVQQVIPEAVCELNGLLHVDYTAVIPFVSDAVNMHTKVLHKQTEDLKQMCERVNRIEAGICALNDRIAKLEQNNLKGQVGQTLVYLPIWIFCLLTLLTISKM